MKSYKGIMTVIAAATLATGTYCCTSSRNKSDDDTRPVLVVSIEPQRQMLEQIAGDNFKIITMLPNGENPESFDPSPARRIDIEKAKAYFTTGQLVFEKNLKMTADNKAKFIDTSNGIKLIYGTHCSHHSTPSSSFFGDDHDQKHSHANQADPHVWASVKNARIAAQTMAATLQKIDPEHNNIYKANLQRYEKHLDSLDNAFSKTIAAIPNPSLMVWHPSLTYFARDYGIEQVAMTDVNKEATAKSLGNLLEKARQSKINIFVYQPQVDNREAEMIYTAIGADTISYNGLAYDWEKELTKIVNVLKRK